MKKDFRVQYPLWQIGFMLFFVLIAIVHTRAISNFVLPNTVWGESIEGFLVFLLFPFFIIAIIALRIKQFKFNREHPSNKFSLWRSKPFEFMEDDEAWQMITRTATQKVYTFFSWSLPISALFHLFVPTSKLLIIINIVALSLVQYIIYYVHVRRYTIEEDE